MSLSKELLRVCEVNRIMMSHLDFHIDLEVDEELIEPAELPRRIIKDRLNPFDLRPLEFRVIFGLTKEFFKELLDLLIPQLTRKNETDRGNLLPIHRLAIFLQYLRTNGFHKSVSTQFFIRVDKSVVTRTVNSVSRIVASLRSKYVTFPTIEEGNQISEAIYKDTGFPGVIGIIDGVWQMNIHLCHSCNRCHCRVTQNISLRMT